MKQMDTMIEKMGSRIATQYRLLLFFLCLFCVVGVACDLESNQPPAAESRTSTPTIVPPTRRPTVTVNLVFIPSSSTPLSTSPPVLQPPTSAITRTPRPTQTPQAVWQTARGANFRICPRVDCRLVSSLPAGVVVRVLSEIEGDLTLGSAVWYIVVLPNGAQAFVHSSLLQRVETPN
jgi:hypothetical protein